MSRDGHHVLIAARLSASEGAAAPHSGHAASRSSPSREYAHVPHLPVLIRRRTRASADISPDSDNIAPTVTVPMTTAASRITPKLQTRISVVAMETPSRPECRTHDSIVQHAAGYRGCNADRCGTTRVPQAAPAADRESAALHVRDSACVGSRLVRRPRPGREPGHSAHGSPDIAQPTSGPRARATYLPPHAPWNPRHPITLYGSRGSVCLFMA